MGTREDKKVSHYVGGTPPPPPPPVAGEEGSGPEKTPGPIFELAYTGYRAMYRDF
jgi:hypothetical protein